MPAINPDNSQVELFVKCHRKHRRQRYPQPTQSKKRQHHIKKSPRSQNPNNGFRNPLHIITSIIHGDVFQNRVLYFVTDMRKQIRTVLALSVVALTIAAFIYYIVKHPETVTQLRHIPPLILVVLLALYAASFLAYVFITRVSLNIFGKTMSRQENILFNAYS